MTVKSLLPSIWEIPASIRERLGEKAGRQRVIFEDGHLLLVLHQPPKPDQAHREAALFWRKPDGAWMSDQAGSGLGGLEELLGKYDAEIYECEQDELKAMSADEYMSVLDRLTPLHRAGTHLYQVLQKARSKVENDRAIINLRDRAYDLERRGDLLYDGTRHSLEFAVAKRAEEQAVASQRMAVAAHRLNLLAAFFFPMVTIAGILGVNLRIPMEDSDSYVPFIGLIVAGLGSGLLLTMMLFSPGRTTRNNHR